MAIGKSSNSWGNLMGLMHLYVAGRQIVLEGNVQTYLDWMHDWDATDCPILQAASRIAPGSTILDVGANIGITSLIMAVQRPDCTIVAFEPVPSNFKCLQANIVRNGFTNITAVQAAVGDRHGSIRMSDNGPWSMAVENGGVETPVVRIDDYIDLPVGFVKIDVEGHEPFTLVGGRELFQKYKPPVYMEFNTMTLLTHHVDAISFARTIYENCDILDTVSQEKSVGVPADPIALVNDNVVYYNSVTDILFVPRDPFPRLDKMVCAPAYFSLKNKPWVKVGQLISQAFS